MEFVDILFLISICLNKLWFIFYNKWLILLLKINHLFFSLLNPKLKTYSSLKYFNNNLYSSCAARQVSNRYPSTCGQFCSPLFFILVLILREVYIIDYKRIKNIFSLISLLFFILVLILRETYTTDYKWFKNTLLS